MASNEKDTVLNLMQLPWDVWAVSFDFTNSHLFQQNFMPALQDVYASVT